MKNFFQFLSESAAQQAARMGLKGDGHGGWYDRHSGEFVAKTEKGKLVFYNKRQKVGGKDPEQTDLEKNISNPNFVDPTLQKQQEGVLQFQVCYLATLHIVPLHFQRLLKIPQPSLSLIQNSSF